MTDQQNSAGRCSLDQLHPKERSVLQHIWRRFAGQSFDDDRLRSMHVQRLSGMEVQLAFVSLRQQGWVQAVKKGWSERLYFIPFDKLQTLQEAFCHLKPEPLTATAVKLLQEGRSGITVDLFNVLVYIAKHHAAMTGKGVLHKKHIQRLGSVAELTPSDVEGLLLRYAHDEAYPPHVAVILDLLLTFELAAPVQGSLKANTAALQHWLTLPREAMDRLVLLNMMERYVPNQAEYQHFTWRICDSSLTRGIWFAVDQLLASSMDRPERDASKAQSLSVEDAAPWVRLLTGCGYTDLGVDEEGRLHFRWRMDPSALLSGGNRNHPVEGQFFIQPDFEILIPPDVSYTVKYTAAMCTERISDDLMTVYRLTRDSVAQAAEAGTGPEKILSFLKEHAGTGVPENVQAALCQWGKDTERSWNPENLPQAGITLKERVEVLACDGSDNRYHAARYVCNPACGLMLPARREFVLELDDCVPDRVSIVPDLNHIPVMWTRDWRSYHSSTAKQMMEQALELSAKLEIAIDGSRMEFIPFQLERQPWKISGALYEPDSEKMGSTVQLGEGEWKEMRLVVP
ncbi:hypothetical protein GCM10008915_13470 [Bifidobacterium pullorum subsp. gallinarum]